MHFLTDEIPSALGAIVIAVREGRLCSLDYGDCRGRMLASLAHRYGAIRARSARDPFGLSRRIRAYLDGDLGAIDGIPVDTGGTAFQQKVWTALRRIPAGTTITYGDLAREIGRPSAVRAAAAANGRNPIAIVVPCHRVVGKDGRLTGYAGGLSRKRWLLAHEGVVTGPGSASATRCSSRPAGRVF